MERSSRIIGSSDLGSICDVTIPITIKVFAEVAVADEVPDRVVMVTRRGPGMAVEEIETWTDARLPSILTDGGLPTVIPSGGVKATPVAPLRLIPFIVRVNVAPTVCWIGMIEFISGKGRATWNIFAPGIDGDAFPAGVSTAMVLGPKGASAAIERVTSIELP